MSQVETYRICLSTNSTASTVLYTRHACTEGSRLLACSAYCRAIWGPLAPRPPATEDEDNIMAALKQSDRVISISLIVTSTLLEKLSSIGSPFSELQELPHQLTDADYQALLVSISQGSSSMISEVMSIQPRFSHTSGANLEAYCVSSHTVEQHRDHFPHAAQHQDRFRAGLTSTKNLPLDYHGQINQAPTFQGHIPPQLMPNHTQLNLSWQALAQRQGKPNTLQPTQLNNGVGLLARPSTAQSKGASSMPLMGTQITGAGSNGGAQNQSGSISASMFAPWTQVSMNGVAPSSILTQSKGAVPKRRPASEDVTFAKRLIEEQKRIAFNNSSSYHFLI